MRPRGLLTPRPRFACTGYTACLEHAKARTGPILHRNMALSQRLEFRQSQALVMTPQLMQAIKLLQLSNLDLTAYVEGELERNPLLERSSEGPPEGNQREEAAAEAPGEAAEVNGSAAIEDSFDTGIENVFPDSAEAPPRPAQQEP